MNGSDRVTLQHDSGLRRLLIKSGTATIVSVRPTRSGAYRFSALAVAPELVSGPGSVALGQADEDTLHDAITDFRFSLGIDEDLAPFRDAFAADPLLGPAISARTELRSQRRADPWEALLWAVTEQLIEYRRAAAIQRRIIRRWGLSIEPDGPGHGRLGTVPAAGIIAGVAPAELQACDLGAKRAIAMIRVSREVSHGRVDLRQPADDRRLLAIPEVGPWTIACLALRGRGDADALPAGDLGHMKLVGALAGLGRPAEVEEVERFYESYAPYRGLAGDFLLAHRGAVVRGPGNRARIRAARRPGRRAA